MNRQIEVTIDTFARIWAARLPNEVSEDQIISRVLSMVSIDPDEVVHAVNGPDLLQQRKISMPASKKWTDVLTWTLDELGGQAALADIYRKSREGRRLIGLQITSEHDASARECLESHCLESEKYRHKANLFCMPLGKGSGVWALRT